MKAFEFGIKGYEAKRNGSTLWIWELDHEGDRLNAAPLEITVSDLYGLINESDSLQRYHNPICMDVTDARTRLENARAVKGDEFELALIMYMDVANRHREASGCTVTH